MDSETKLKIKVLNDNNVITNEELSFLESIDLKLKNILNNDNINDGMFLVHFAMIFDRNHKNEQIEDIPEEIIEQLKNSHEYNKAIKILKDLEIETYINLSVAEKKYLVMHMENTLQEIEK